MANLSVVLKDEITRLAKKATKQQFADLQKKYAQQRQQIAALRQEIKTLRGELSSKAKQSKASAAQPADEGQKLRFQPKGLASERKRLGLSAGDYGRLAGVSGQSIYAWESGKSSPRRAQLLALAALRGIGKRDVAKRLAEPEVVE